MNALAKSLGVGILLVSIGWVSSSMAGDAVVPTLTLSREDVVRDSIKRFEIKGTTNEWLFVWEYSERGSSRIRTFRETHVGQQTRMRIGDYETRPRLVKTMWDTGQGLSINSTNIGGITNKGTQVLRVNAEDAKKILAEFETK